MVYGRSLKVLTNVIATGMNFSRPEAPRQPPGAPKEHAAQEPHAHEACPTCSVHALLADADAILQGAARICPKEGLAWDVVGGFAVAREKVRDAMKSLDTLAHHGGQAEAEQLRALLPDLEQRLAHVRDCQDLHDLAGRSGQALAIAFEGQRAVRRRREPRRVVSEHVLQLAKKVQAGEMTREDAVKQLTSVAHGAG